MDHNKDSFIETIVSVGQLSHLQKDIDVVSICEHWIDMSWKQTTHMHLLVQY